ncbi:hypothetical protein CCACVL1_10444 [Corchorus capsularis]|uniref:Uncharacterized protein n=1 Tax=Corchorus capsularis TaxID=210143 RepID=A0A1R3IR46_COCAP|nr:hypothetical protein CCACVL1_10444 [Corchorus capsularis]
MEEEEQGFASSSRRKSMGFGWEESQNDIDKNQVFGGLKKKLKKTS